MWFCLKYLLIPNVLFSKPTLGSYQDILYLVLAFEIPTGGYLRVSQVSIFPQVLSTKQSQPGQQRVILPATSHTPQPIAARPSTTTLSTGQQSIGSLNQGTTLNLQTVPGIQGFALIPAQYVTQVRSEPEKCSVNISVMLMI